MRDDLTPIVSARRLRGAGLVWRPAVGDWCALANGAHAGGMYLVVEADATIGWATLLEPEGRWPAARIAAADGLWLPTLGQLKNVARGWGWRVATFEHVPPAALAAWTRDIPGLTPPAAATLPHRCVLTAAVGATSIQTEGFSEVEALAEALIAAMPR